MCFKTLLLDMYIYDCYVFLDEHFFYHREIFLFISGKMIFIDIYLIWYQYDYCILLMPTVFMAHLFPSFTFNLFKSLLSDLL